MDDVTKRFRDLAARQLRLARATAQASMRLRRVNLAHSYKFLAHDEELLRKAPQRSRPKSWQVQVSR
jgi:hypothetical protein